MSGPTSLTSSSRSTDFGSPASDPSTRSRVRSPSTSSWVGATPTSAVSRVSSIASQVSSSRRSRDSRASSPRPKPPCAPASRWRSRTSRDAAVSGFSTVGAAGSSTSRSSATGTSVSSRGGEMTSVPCVGAGTALRRRPLASKPASRPIATTAMPMIRYSQSPMATIQPAAESGAESGAVLARTGVGPRRPGSRAATRASPASHRRRASRRRARARRSAATARPCASAVPATAHRAGPRRGAGRRRTRPRHPATSTITTIATTI